MKKSFFCVYIALLICSTGCKSGLLNKDEAADYFTQGFISRHCYQVLVTATPTKGISGMVDSRESAYYMARENVIKQAENSLTGYVLKNACGSGIQEKDSGAHKEYLRREVKKYLRYGKISEEYYKKDKTVVLVFRITRKNLKQKLDSINCRKNNTKVTGE